MASAAMKTSSAATAAKVVSPTARSWAQIAAAGVKPAACEVLVEGPVKVSRPAVPEYMPKEEIVNDAVQLRADAPEFTPLMRAAAVYPAPKPFNFQAVPVITPTMFQFESMPVTSSSRPLRKHVSEMQRSIGKVLQLFGKYGWISPLEDIDHSDAWRNGGRIYFALKDVVGTYGRTLRAGALVSFDVYADDQGLGACKVHVEEIDEHVEEEDDLLFASHTQIALPEKVEIPPFAALDNDGCASWDLRNLAASAKIHAEVGDDIRWDVMLDALAGIAPAARLLVSPTEMHGAKVLAGSQASACGGGSTRTSPSSYRSSSSSSEINSDSEDDVQSSRIGRGAGAGGGALARLPPGLVGNAVF